MLTKKLIVVFLVVLLLLCYTLPGFANERVAVLGFSGRVGEEYRTTAINKLTKILLNFGKYDVVERAEIERILAEQNFQASDAVDPNTAVQIGKLLGISMAYIGSIDQLTANFNKNSYTYTAVAKITIKVIEVQTAKIVNFIENSWSITDKDRETALHTALEGCFTDRILADIRAKIAPFSKVYKVDGDVLYFVNGKDLGVIKGMRYRIMRPEKSGFDLPADVAGQNTTMDDSSFKRQIGLVEVTEVVADKSQAKIIWKSESVKNGDLLQEVINPGLGFIGLQLRFTGSSLNESTQVYEGTFGVDVPYKGSGKLTMGFTPLTDVGVFNFGYQMGWETPIIPGILYLSPNCAAGLAIAGQGYYVSQTPYTAIAGGFYLNGGCGLKLYLNHESGMRVELGVVGQLGPSFGKWADSEISEVDVTGDVAHPNVRVGGIGLQFSINF